MENGWFLFDLSTKQITQVYLGYADEWTNVPNGMGVIGPLTKEEKTMDALYNPDCYKVENDNLIPLPNIDEIKARKEAEKEQQSHLPTLDQQVEQMQEVINMLMMEGL